MDTTRRSPTFPALHVRPPRGWVNDPNGLAHVDGVYHVFFQHNPAATVHDAITWGHASSPDLLRWTDEPLALRPRPGEADAAGCWTGCVVDDAGVPTAVYSAVADGSGRSQVLLARSDRTLRDWHQETHGVAPMPAGPETTDVRDPFVLHHDGHRYAVQGAGRAGGVARVLLHGCDDLTRWTPPVDLLTAEHPVAAEHADAEIWECPCLLPLGGRWVLVVSRVVAGAPAGASYLVGDLVGSGSGLRFTPTAGGSLDSGPACYAPQVLVDGGRALLWGWAQELGRRPEQVLEAGWAGVLTFPRELELDGEVLLSRPAAELVGLRREQVSWRDGLRERAFEVSGVGAASLHLVDEDSRPAEGGTVEVAEVDGVDGVDRDVPWRVLVDGSIVEVFAGATPLTTRAYPTATSTWRLSCADPGSVTAWRLGL